MLNCQKLFGSAIGISTKNCAPISRVPRRSVRCSWGSSSRSYFPPGRGYDALDQRILQTQADQTSLLMVLKHPEIPWHNNPAELAARFRVRKRVASYGPRSAAGAQAWDAMETLLGTAKKLGVNFFQYIRDRVSGARQMPSLAELIKQRSTLTKLSPSWAST